MFEAIDSCTVTGRPSETTNTKTWEGYVHELCATPRGEFTIGSAAASFAIEISVTDKNKVILVFRNAAGRLCINTIADPEFYGVAQAFRVEDNKAETVRQSRNLEKMRKHSAARTSLLNTGSEILTRLLEDRTSGIKIAPDCARNLFALCAHALRDGPG